MFSKKLLNTYIDLRLKQKGWSYNQLAKELGVSQSNLTRSMNSEPHNFTLPQFAALCTLLELTAEQILHILTGKKGKEAKLQLIQSGIAKVLKEME